MRWYYWLLVFQSMFLSGAAAFGFGWSTYKLLSDKSGLNGHAYSLHGMTYESYLTLNIVVASISTIILGLSIYAARKKNENLVLLVSGVFITFLFGVVLYNIYCL